MAGIIYGKLDRWQHPVANHDGHGSLPRDRFGWNLRVDLSGAHIANWRGKPVDEDGCGLQNIRPRSTVRLRWARRQVGAEQGNYGTRRYRSWLESIRAHHDR